MILLHLRLGCVLAAYAHDPTSPPAGVTRAVGELCVTCNEYYRGDSEFATF